MSLDIFRDAVNNLEKQPPRSIAVAESSSRNEPRVHSELFINSPTNRIRAWVAAYNLNTTIVDVRGNILTNGARFTTRELVYGERYLARKQEEGSEIGDGNRERPMIMEVKYHGIDDAAALDY